MKLFADNVKLYSSLAYSSCDLQVVCDRLAAWAEEWQLRIAYNKCISHRISNRAAADGNSIYRIGSHVLCWSDETRDLGVIIDNKLNFNCHISAIGHKAHVRASLILRSFVTRDPVVLTKAFVTRVRPILEYCTSVWSPHTVSNINKIESCKRWFTKRIKGLSDKQYPERLASLGLETLQARRLKCDFKFIIKYLYLLMISWCLLTVRVLEDIVINCTRVIRRLTCTNISSQTVFVISGMHNRAQ